MIDVKRQWRLGLIGWPLEHSWSPLIHQAAFDSLGWSGTYRLIPVAEGYPDKLRLVCERVRRGDLDGFNVTIPHKQRVMDWLDDLTPAAGRIGAVNTVFLSDGRLIGGNTDAPGFIQDLHGCFGQDFSQGLCSALVMGAGGAARAVVYALQEAGWLVIVAARRPEQARRLATDLRRPGGDLRWTSLDRDELMQLQPDLVVNATPVGMFPDMAASPWPDEVAFPEGARLYDLIYNPPETTLMQKVRQSDLQAANGSGMLVAQAALAFERWTGVCPPLSEMRAALAQALPESGEEKQDD